MPRQLPDHPNVEYLKKQAKDLLGSFKAGYEAATLRIIETFPPLIGRTEAEAAAFPLALHHAQTVIAREYGFPTWRQLLIYVKKVNPSPTVNAVTNEQFIRACINGTAEEAARMGNAVPEDPKDYYVACARLDSAAVRSAIEKDRSLAVTAGGPLRWEPILYVCFSKLQRTSQARAAAAAEIARTLLDNGANPNTSFHYEDNPDLPLPALYGAAGVANNLDLVAVLLDAGANPNDNESLYHSAEFRDHRCLELLLKRGAVVNGTNAMLRMLDFEDAEGLRIMLDYGGDPNESGHSALNHAIVRGRSAEIIRILLERDADPNTINDDGLTPYQMVVRLGRPDLAELLVEKGATTTLSPRDEFFAACAAGDSQSVAQVVRANPEMIEELNGADLRVLTDAASKGNTQAVVSMLDAGVPVDATGEYGATALHWAAWNGHAGTVKALLERKASVSVEEPTYHATPLGWALHGSIHSRTHDGEYLYAAADHPAIVRMLVRAGSPIPENAEGTPPAMDALRGL